MKWSNFSKPGTTFVPGDFNVIDDLTGMEVKASKTSKQWDGFRSTHSQPRHEQDFLRGRAERIRTPWARPEATDSFVESTNNMTPWQPATSYAMGATVVVNGVTRTANEAHTSSAAFVLDINKWDR